MAAFDDDDKDDKTEDATPRRRQEAREKGQVAYSSELMAALTLIGWLMTFAIAGGELIEELGRVVVVGVETACTLGRGELTPEKVSAALTTFARHTGWRTLAFIAPLFALSLLLGYAQVGFLIAPQAVQLDPGRVDPTRGMGRVFSLRTLGRTLLSFTKFIVVVATVGAVAWSHIDEVVDVGDQEIGPALAGFGHIAMRCACAALAAVLTLALLDYWMQRREYEKDLRMSKKEIKEEARSSEGDPQVKARIRRMQREMASRRMMADVPKSTVVITNPTHFAVALSYDRDADPKDRGAPRVVAKGADLVAQRIKEVAREAGVIVYEDAPLARTLHARCEIGDEVPIELYQAVAEVLAYVYGIQGSSRAAAAV